MTSNTRPDSWPDLMSPVVAADYIDSTEGTIRRYIRDGVLPYSKPGGRLKSRIFIRRADLDALIEANYRPATSGPLAKRD